MKAIIIVAIFFSLSITIFSQDTVYFQPGPNDGKDARLNEHQPYLNFGNAEDFISYYWTFSGTPAMGVSLIQFEIDEIPSQMIILEAKLSLYHNPSSVSAGQAGDNASFLKKITTFWDENSVTWNSMPEVTNLGAIYLNSSEFPNQDYLDIDVTEIVSDWHNSPENNFGLMLEIIEQSTYRSMKFASSDCADETLRPMLMVVYAREIPWQNCVTLQPGPDDGIDARLHGYYPDQNFGDVEEFLSYYWTFNGNAAPGYSAIKFDISEIPENVSITSALLSLSYINSPSAGQYGENACSLNKIIETWDEHTVTWNNMPQTTDDFQVNLEQSVSADQNYADINITNFVLDWYNNPNENFGMMLKINDFELYRSMKFASSDCSESALRPKLEICYDIVSSDHPESSNTNIEVYPNPGNGLFTLLVNDDFVNSEAKVFDITGKEIIALKIIENNQQFDLTGFPNGIYFLKFCNLNQSKVVKLLKI